MPTDDERTQQTPRDPEAVPTPEDMTLALIEEQADRSIRRIMHDGRLFFSVIDVIGVLSVCLLIRLMRALIGVS